LFGGFTRLAIFSSVSTLLMDLAVVLASVRLRRLGVQADQPPVRLPGGLLIPAIATVLIAVLLFAATRDELIAVSGFIALVSVSYLVRQRLRSQDALARRREDAEQSRRGDAENTEGPLGASPRRLDGH
jgi:hypothetical protein